MKVPFDIRFCAESWREGAESATVAAKAVLRIRRFWRRSIIAGPRRSQELHRSFVLKRLDDQALNNPAL